MRDDGEIKDEASLGLRDIRREQETYDKYEYLKKKFDELMNNKETARAIQRKEW